MSSIHTPACPAPAETDHTKKEKMLLLPEMITLKMLTNIFGRHNTSTYKVREYVIQDIVMVETPSERSTGGIQKKVTQRGDGRHQNVNLKL